MDYFALVKECIVLKTIALKKSFKFLNICFLLI